MVQRRTSSSCHVECEGAPIAGAVPTLRAPGEQTFYGENMSQTRNERALILEIENVPHGGSQESLLQVLTCLMYWAGERDLQEQVGDLIKFVNNTADSAASLEELLELLDATDAEDAEKIIKELTKNEVPGVEESPGTDLQRLES